MTAAGIVAEYNPFHAGHAYHIAETRRLLGADTAIVCVMSGSWVQRGDCAVFDKWTRARLALEGGADLVLELPTVWALSSAEGFARGAVAILAATGVVSRLSFGSECGDGDKLRRVAACLDSDACAAALRRQLDSGLPFALCRQRAAEELLGPDLAGLLEGPNNNLGVEYLRALRVLRALNAPGSEIQPVTVLRRGAGHDGGDHPDFPSASFLREELRKTGSASAGLASLPLRGNDRSGSASAANLAHCERAILARLRTMTAADWAKLPDSGVAEGLPRRLERAGRACTCLAEFWELAKTKRYAHARLRRLVLWAFLGLTAADRPDAPPYLRVLGLNGRGREVLREMKDRASLPVLTKPAHIRQFGPEAQALFALEERCTGLYGLCFASPTPCGRDWTMSPVIQS